jgi:flavodoxin
MYMRTLVVFYSRTGNTRKVGEKIANILKADIDEVIDKTDRSGIRGWLGGGKDAFFKNPTFIHFKKDPSKYDLVIIGTPVWAATQAPAVRTYLSEHKLKSVAFFCTYGGSEGKTFSEMELVSKKPVATLGLVDRKIGTPESLSKIKEFCRKIK